MIPSILWKVCAKCVVIHCVCASDCETTVLQMEGGIPGEPKGPTLVLFKSARTPLDGSITRLVKSAGKELTEAQSITRPTSFFAQLEPLDQLIVLPLMTPSDPK